MLVMRSSWRFQCDGFADVVTAGFYNFDVVVVDERIAYRRAVCLAPEQLAHALRGEEPISRLLFLGKFA